MAECEVNPYQSPTTVDDPTWHRGIAPGAIRPAYKLYSVGSVTLGTFLGSPLAGGALMAVNYKRLGRAGAAIHAVVWTAVATAAIFAVSFFLPDDANVPTGAFVVPQLLGMYGAAKSLQGPTIRVHQKAGGRMASAWGAAGIGLLIGLFLFGAVFGTVMLLTPDELDEEVGFYSSYMSSPAHLPGGGGAITSKALTPGPSPGGRGEMAGRPLTWRRDAGGGQPGRAAALAPGQGRSSRPQSRIA